MRALFIKSSCPFCRMALMPIEEINAKLPIGKRIDVIDCKDWENFGLKTLPIMDKFKFDGYPTLFLDGIEIKNILAKDQLRSFLNGYFEKEKIVD